MPKKKSSARFPYEKKDPSSDEEKQGITLKPSVSRLRTINEACRKLGVSRSSFIIAAAVDRATTFLDGLAKDAGADPAELIHRTDEALRAWRKAFGVNPPTGSNQ